MTQAWGASQGEAKPLGWRPRLVSMRSGRRQTALIAGRVDDFAAVLGHQRRQRLNANALGHETDRPVGKPDVGPARVEAVNVALEVVAVHHAGALADVIAAIGVGPRDCQPVVGIGPDWARDARRVVVGNAV